MASMRPGHYCPGKRLRTRTGPGRPGERFNEARALLPGKTSRVGRTQVSAIGASMRPGHYCPGKQAEASVAAVCLAGFNEARALLPGKTWWPPESMAPAWMGFNEARALLPGKTFWLHGKHKPSSSFNEARALLPGKTPDHQERPGRSLHGASMRPGHYCPGKRGGLHPVEQAWRIRLDSSGSRFEAVAWRSRAGFVLHHVQEPWKIKDFHFASGSGVSAGTGPLAWQRRRTQS